MSLKTFFNNTFLVNNSLKDILDLYPNVSEKGFKFEKCADLLIKFGFLPEFGNNKYKHIIGNVNKGKIEILKDLRHYIDTENENSGKKTGISDITLYNEIENKYIFISCKYYSNESNVKNYDIQDIKTMIDYNKHIYKNYEIYLLVNDKNELIDKILRANEASKYITTHIENNKIIDKNDLEKAFVSMKSYINKGNNIFDNFIFNKEILNYKFHQKLIEIKFFKQILLNKDRFLLGLKPRSGKTYIVGFIISNDKKNYENFNILVITPAPNETSSQFLEMFNSYIDFNEFNIIHLNKGDMIDNLRFTNKNIIITSKQLLQNYIKNNAITIIQNLNLNYIFFDENHYGGTTDLSKDIIYTYKTNTTKLVFLTATFHKPLNEWNIPKKCSFYWELEDEHMCKNNNIDGLKEKHGDEVIEALEYFNDLSVLTSYDKMPELELITTMFEANIFNNIKQQLLEHNNNKYGFSLKTLFSILNSTFKFEREVELLLRYISGSNRVIDFPDGDKSIFGRIKDISLKKGSRTLLSNHNFTTQLWFLPFGIDQRINDVSENLKKLMLKDLILKHYEILILNSNIDRPVKDIKEEIKIKELFGKENGKSGLIVLVGNQCSLGITLENCDIVILLNDILSSDKIYQMMYRSMTEAPNKKCGFIVDLNINRVLNTIMDYSLYNKDFNSENKIKYIVENHLINIDSDYFLNKSIDEQTIINNLLDIWKNDPINHLRKILKNIETEIIEINNDDQQKLNNYFTKSFDDTNPTVNFFEDGDGQEINDGQTIKKENKSDSGSDISSLSEENNNKKEEIKISLTKDVLPFIIPLICFLTIKENNKNFLEMLNMVKYNEELLEIFNEQTFLWWNKTNIIDIVNYLIKKYIKENSDIYNSTIIIKMTLQSLIDKPSELLEFINDCLKPKEIEKKKYGEVFTPVPLINEMLDKLPVEVWNNPDLKWLDPANGMGNFPICVYYRLMEGLKNIILDQELRKKHILENMLYMSEINKKNCFLTKQIFDINNKYRLNIYNGNSLELNHLTLWNIEKFDIIMGNPPYNASGTKATGNTIWQLFVINSLTILKDNGYLCFIHPNGWRKPNTEKGKFYGLFDKMTKENTIIYLEIHDTKDGMKYFHCGTRYDWYILQKNINNNNKTKIIDQNNVLYEINLNKYNWLANSELELIDKLIANENEEKCKVLYSRSNYGADKKWISKIENKEFKYPVVHSTPKEGYRFVWSNKNDNGFYGIKKVIFGDSGINNPIIDIEGKYAMSQHAMAIIIDDYEEGIKLSKVLCSSMFDKILKACLWSSFAIEWGMFKDFKINFYEYILSNDIECDNRSISSKSTVKSNKSSKSNDSNIVLCGFPLKKKGETCKNKANPQCNGRCKKHFVLVI